MPSMPDEDRTEDDRTNSIQDKALEIRPIKPEELDAALEVYRQCQDFLALGPVATASMDMVLTDLEISRREGGVFCGIWTVDGLIGVADYVPSPYQGDPQAAYLALLMIAAAHRNQGIGAAVVEAIEGEIRKDGQVSVIWAGVQVNNAQAVRFWLRQGYRIVGGPELMPDQTTVYGLQKDL